ncbi:MAG: protease inhibitor I42 family protein [Chloroflexi bacterium]|nr:protease inhibitor I42 family protein [Chloroflexota bacterium]
MAIKPGFRFLAAMFISFFLICSAAAFLPPPAWAETDETLLLTKADNGETIDVHEGDIFKIKLEYNAGTGYTWVVAPVRPDIVEMTEEPEIIPPPPDLLGGRGYVIFSFEAMEAGSTAVVIDYLRPWEKEKPAETFKIKVNIEKEKTAENLNYIVVPKSIKEKTENYSIDIEYPGLEELPDAGIRAKLNNAVKSQVDDIVRNFKDDIGKTKFSADEQLMPLMLQLDWKAEYKSPGLISLVFKGGAYQGGAHPGPVVLTMLLDLKTGDEIKLGGLFKPDSKYLDELSKICIDDLSKNEELDKEWIKQGTSPSEDNFSNFYITEDSLAVIFPPYQVGPYAAGYQEIFIPYEKLKEIINPEGPLEDIVSKD